MDEWLMKSWRTVALVVLLFLVWLGVTQWGGGSQYGATSGRQKSGLLSSTANIRSGHSISKVGKRHNSGCRYYNSSYSRGPNDGTPSKVCGG